ncbi:MAG: molybdopterin molybdotransferase MoeA, partial [Phycisphaerales bacterium]|nr:molybdopterin molybdotransferase MoeA [Phycisphaerales bacterium]
MSTHTPPSPEDAIGLMLARLEALERDSGRLARGAVERPLMESLGMVLAAPVAADRDSPAFDHAAMDGYAVRVADLERLAGASGERQLLLAVAGESRIGAPPPDMPREPTCVRIATGAPLPGGSWPADAVLKREQVVEFQDDAGRGRVARIGVPRDAAVSVSAGQHIRRRAENRRAGEPVCAAGSRITAATIGVLAAVGCVRPLVRPPLRVAIITTGDEVVGPDARPGPFQIRNSNGPCLHAAMVGDPWLQPLDPVHVPDDDAQLDDAIAHALSHADAVVLAGGVSAG